VILKGERKGASERRRRDCSRKSDADWNAPDLTEFNGLSAETIGVRSAAAEEDVDNDDADDEVEDDAGVATPAACTMMLGCGADSCATGRT